MSWSDMSGGVGSWCVQFGDLIRPRCWYDLSDELNRYGRWVDLMCPTCWSDVSDVSRIWSVRCIDLIFSDVLIWSVQYVDLICMMSWWDLSDIVIWYLLYVDLICPVYWYDFFDVLIWAVRWVDLICPICKSDSSHELIGSVRFVGLIRPTCWSDLTDMLVWFVRYVDLICRMRRSDISDSSRMWSIRWVRTFPAFCGTFVRHTLLWLYDCWRGYNETCAFSETLWGHDARCWQHVFEGWLTFWPMPVYHYVCPVSGDIVHVLIFKSHVWWS